MSSPRDIPLVMSFLQFYVDCDNNEFCHGDLITLMLLGLGGTKNLFQHMDMPIIPDVCVDLNCMSQSDCRAAFRFDQEEMKRTVCLLPFPDIIITKQRDRVHLSEAYTIFCRRHFDGVICTKSLDNLQVPYQEFSGLCYI